MKWHFTHLLGIVLPILSMGHLGAQQKIERGFVEQFKFSGGIVVALDFNFNDGEFIANLGTDKPFIIHALLGDNDQLKTARNTIRKAGVYGKVSCDTYNWT